MQDGNPDSTQIPLISINKNEMSNEPPVPDCGERTPLHESVEKNNADNVRVLVDEDETNMNGTTALHRAVMSGSKDATEILITKITKSNKERLIQKCKNSGSTPLHIAATTGSIEILTVLLQKMSCIWENDERASYIDICNKEGETALHRAASEGHRECVQALISRGANLAKTNNKGVTAVDAIFRNHRISQPLDILTDALNSCVTPPNADLSSNFKEINVNFGILAPKDQMQLAVIEAINVTVSDIKQQAILLQHPVVETFLRLKWERLRKYFILHIIINISFAVCLSSYALTFLQNDTDHVIIRRLTAGSSLLFLVYHIIQVIVEPWIYLKQSETWLSFICAILSLITSIAGEFVVKCSKEEIESRHCMDWIPCVNSITILLSYVQIMFLFSRIIMWVDYKFIFCTTLKIILKVLLSFGSLIIGFAVSFAVLFPGNDDFKNFWSPLKTTVVMMMDKYEYDNLLNTTTSENGESTFLMAPSRFLFIIFIMIASSVLSNLVISLVTNEIEQFEKKGYKNRLLNHVKFFAQQEILMSHKIFPEKWLPSRLEEQLLWSCDVTPNITVSRNEYDNFFDILNSNIPVHLKDALFRLAKKSFKDDNLADRNRIGEP